MHRSAPLLLPLLLLCLHSSASAQDRLAEVPHKAALKEAPDKYLAVFELRDDTFIGKAVRDKKAAKLGLSCWKRIKAIFPLSYRKLLVQFNIMRGRGLAGSFSGAGTNDVKRKGYRLSIAKYTAAEEKRVHDPNRPVSARRGTLDWTIVHELGHYICLRIWVIERFSQSFDGDSASQPERREKPKDYPKDGSPRVTGNFVTSYAERKGGDEEVVETFTTYMLVKTLPPSTDNSLVARKLRFMETIPGFPELRKRIQSLGKPKGTTKKAGGKKARKKKTKRSQRGS